MSGRCEWTHFLVGFHFSSEHEHMLVVLLLVMFEVEEVAASRELPLNYARFFRAFGHRIRSLRVERKLSQEDMYSHGFSVRHWQMIEAGRPFTMFTFLRICEAFNIEPEQLIAGLGGHLRKRKA